MSQLRQRLRRATRVAASCISTMPWRWPGQRPRKRSRWWKATSAARGASGAATTSHSCCYFHFKYKLRTKIELIQLNCQRGKRFLLLFKWIARFIQFHVHLLHPVRDTPNADIRPLITLFYFSIYLTTQWIQFTISSDFITLEKGEKNPREWRLFNTSHVAHVADIVIWISK